MDAHGCDSDASLAFETRLAEAIAPSGATPSSPLPEDAEIAAVVQALRPLCLPDLASPGLSTPERALLLGAARTRLCRQIGLALVAEGDPVARADELARAFLERLPEVARLLATDLAAARDRDPAARSAAEIALCYPGLLALSVHRMAHELHRLSVPFLPRMMAEQAHRATGIDIHPGARIGPGFFIDHGTGVVIGETTEIGAGCTVYQGVTLGALSFPRDADGRLVREAKRHPTLEDDVTIYAGATVLGGDTVIGRGSVVAGGVFLTRSVPPDHVVQGPRLELRIRSQRRDEW